MQSKRAQIAVALALILGAAAARILPHVPNVSPIAAVSLFGGFFFASRRTAVMVPLAALLLSDAVLGFYDLRVMAVVYAALLVPVLFARSPSLVRATVGSVGASTVFFAVSNFAVWAFSGMYEHTVVGLAECYTLALPFFQNTLLGDLAFTLLLFGTYAAVVAVQRKRHSAAAHAVANG
jgi:hypothetical protein